MANGLQRSEENISIFLSWVASKTESEFRDMVVRGQLSRQEIARECGFARSVLLQNPRVKEALRSLEQRLREQNILPQLAESPHADTTVSSQPDQSRSAVDQHRLKRLEAENASLRAELEKLRADLDSFRIMESVLVETGRLPR